MYIKNLKINNLRNIRSAEIDPHPVLNLLLGDNGAGKTSVLESLIVLAKGRSFRSGPIGSLIGPEGESFRVTAVLQATSSTKHAVGIERSSEHWRARAHGHDVKQLSDLAEHLPLVLMEPNSHQLISGPPDGRRRFLDWGVFHVEHHFLSTWRRFARALKQRNAALRMRDAALVHSIDPLVADLGQQIDTLRARQLERLMAILPQKLATLAPSLPAIEIRYQKGWSGDSLGEALDRATHRDMERGSTSPGPHRADLLLFSREQAARETLSRGEQKLVSAALLLTQADNIASAGRQPVLLLDDLASEFDQHYLKGVLSAGLEAGGQLWITGTAMHDVYRSLDQASRVFHVEHGSIQKTTKA